MTVYSSTSTSRYQPLLWLFLLSLTFFSWGVLTSANSMLVPHFQKVFGLSYQHSMLVQTTFYLAPFIASIPISILMNRLGYKAALLLSLSFAGLGALLFSFAMSLGSFATALFAVFIIAMGVAAMQVIANPYVAQLGTTASASRRLTMASSINSLGTTLAPLALGMALAAYGIGSFYLVMALGACLIGAMIWRSDIPDFSHKTPLQVLPQLKALFHHKSFTFGAVAIFIYVGVEVAVGTVTISYLQHEDYGNLTAVKAASLVSLYWAGSMIGRFTYSALAKTWEPMLCLKVSAMVAIGLLLFAITNTNLYGGVALIAIGLCNSFMYPVIFAKSIEGLGALTSSGSAILVMCGIGGGVVPFVQASVVDSFSIQLSYLVPLIGYGLIHVYAELSQTLSNSQGKQELQKGLSY